jgi:hypothetical protein
VILKPKLETFPNISKERQRKISAKVVGTTIPPERCTKCSIV